MEGSEWIGDILEVDLAGLVNGLSRFEGKREIEFNTWFLSN